MFCPSLDTIILTFNCAHALSLLIKTQALKSEDALSYLVFREYGLYVLKRGRKENREEGRKKDRKEGGKERRKGGGILTL